MLLNKKEAAAKLGISVPTLDRERQRGNIEWVEVGGQIRFMPEQLEEYLRRRTRPVHKTK